MPRPPLRLLALLAAAALACAPAARAQHDHPQTAEDGGVPLQLGTVHFPNAAAEAAQAPFLRGLALLHSYEYPDARAAFRAAQDADPGFALAYWLEAFAHTQFDWGMEDLPAARGVLARLGPTTEARLAKAAAPAERALGAAVETLLADGTRPERAQRFADATRAWADADPGVEAAAFAARSGLFQIIEATPAERVQRTEEAIALAERALAIEPEHPGAVHYFIHATDAPRFAARGLAAARLYDRIAPGAEHALHMPSHIFLQLGMWDDMVASNERAWAASRAWVARGGHSAADAGWHSLQWLQYGYLQQGRFAAAAAVLDTAQAILAAAEAEAPGRYAGVQHAVETLAFQYGMETGEWSRYPAADTAAAAERILNASTPRGGLTAAHAAYHAGTAALRGADDTARAAAFLRGLRAAAAARPEDDPLGRVLRGLATQLDGSYAWATGRREAALDTLARAAEAAGDAGLAPVGPPGSLPAAEVLGAALLEAERPREAADAYARALEHRPNRSAAWLGLARARAAAGDAAGAAEAYRRLLGNWHRDDADAPARAEARAAVEAARPH